MNEITNWEEYRRKDIIASPGWNGAVYENTPTHSGRNTFTEMYEQSSPAQQQSESSKVVGTGLQGGASINPYAWQVRRLKEAARFFTELSKLAQTFSYAKSNTAGVDELLQTNTGKERYSSFDKEAFKLKNRGNKYINAKRGGY